MFVRQTLQSIESSVLALAHALLYQSSSKSSNADMLGQCSESSWVVTCSMFVFASASLNSIIQDELSHFHGDYQTMYVFEWHDEMVFVLWEFTKHSQLP